MNNKLKIVCPECHTGISFDSGTTRLQCPVCLQKIQIESGVQEPSHEPPKAPDAVDTSMLSEPPRTSIPVKKAEAPKAPESASAHEFTEPHSLPPINLKRPPPKEKPPPEEKPEIEIPPMPKAKQNKSSIMPLIGCLAAILLLFFIIIVALLLMLLSGNSKEKDPVTTAPIESPDGKGITQVPPSATVLPEKDGTEAIAEDKPIPEKEKEKAAEPAAPVNEKPKAIPEKKHVDTSGTESYSEAEPAAETSPAMKADEKKLSEKYSDTALREKIISASKYDDLQAGRGKNADMKTIDSEIKRLLREKVESRFSDAVLRRVKKEADMKFSSAYLLSPEQQFPESMLEKTKAEAGKKYAIINVGDKIEFESGVRRYDGVYNGFKGGNAILLDASVIPIEDVPEDIVSRLSKDGVEKATQKYIDDKYCIPKKKYEKSWKNETAELDEKRSKYLDESFFMPKQNFMKSEREQITSQVFTSYGFRFNEWSAKWEYKDEFVENILARIKESMTTVDGLLLEKESSGKELAEAELVLAKMEGEYEKIRSRIKDFRQISFSGYYIKTLDENLYEVAERQGSGWNSYPSSKHLVLISTRSFSYYSNEFTMKVFKCEIRDDTKRYSKICDGLLDANDYLSIENSLKEKRTELSERRASHGEIEKETGRIERLFKKYGINP